MHPGNNLTRDEARRRAQLIQTPLYDISLDMSRDSETFTCEATIHFLCPEPGASSFIDFFAPSVDSCELNGEEVPKESFNGARIALNNLRDANELSVGEGGEERLLSRERCLVALVYKPGAGCVLGC